MDVEEVDVTTCGTTRSRNSGCKIGFRVGKRRKSELGNQTRDSNTIVSCEAYGVLNGSTDVWLNIRKNLLLDHALPYCARLAMPNTRNGVDVHQLLS